MVYRIFVEKKKELANEAKALASDIFSFLGITSLSKVRIFNRYDVENIDKELFDYAVNTVFSEPQLDITYEEIESAGAYCFAVEYLPGQFDQRADSAAQCIQLISQGERPTVRTAKVYLIYGALTAEEIAKIKKHVINPVESREATLERFETLVTEQDIPTSVKTLDGFCKLDRSGLEKFIADNGLAMDIDDITFCQSYFKSEDRDPTITEIKMIDTYWSDHCRHTTFLTTVDSVKFEDETLQKAYERYIDTRKALNRTKPVNLMDIGTLAAKFLKSQGKLEGLDESEEINACTVKIKVNVEGEEQDWLLLFKNETHNHPTEIEPFGGAATCIGGAIRDPLSGRSYVYAAMRVTGAADPLKPLEETMAGKLPQRKIVTTAAAGYSSYGNQIGLATGQVDELYHDGYAAKRMEIGAVIAAAPAENVRRERPDPEDIVILLGGRTGRDGCGGATGSSKSHNLSSLESCGAEVQKGNAPEERKLQRLFRNPEASKMIKRCNDFGAGGVSVAVGELADGLDINLNAVPKKYDGLDGTELAISESQERMAVVVAPEDVEAFKDLASKENLEATVIAKVKADPRLTMKWNDKVICDISREFLNSNGAEKHIDVEVAQPKFLEAKKCDSFEKAMKELAGDLNVCSKRGLSERFDSTIGAGTVLMPFGGKYQQTPIQSMVHKVSVEKQTTDTVSFMSWGYNPMISEASPYHGAYLAVVESVSKLVATGAGRESTYLTFQEYFEKPMKDPKRWGKPMAALLGSFNAQLDLEIGSIGGKDSMSGSFEKLDVPPTLVSFAVSTGKVSDVVSPELKGAGHRLVWMLPKYTEHILPEKNSLKALYKKVNELTGSGSAAAVWTLGFGGAAEGLMKMAFGNGIGVEIFENVALDSLFENKYGSFIVELTNGEALDSADYDVVELGRTTEKEAIVYGSESVELSQLLKVYEDKLESVYSCNIPSKGDVIPAFDYSVTQRQAPAIKVAKPKVIIPVFPGTNCEFDTAKVMAKAGAEPEIIVINNLSASKVAESVEYFAKRVKESQMIFIPGGFSGGDEPDGSGKFITAFFRNGAVKESTNELLKVRDGLMCGVCNGFQALIKLGLVPYGEIIDTDSSCPTLTFNTIARHQSRLVKTRIASNKSPWLAATNPGDIYTVAISHGEGRFLADEKLIRELAKNGQIATQYVDLNGQPTDDVHFNPNDSCFAIEGITSPDGHVLGKMGHSERIGDGLYKNVEGCYDMQMFKSAVEYFK